MSKQNQRGGAASAEAVMDKPITPVVEVPQQSSRLPLPLVLAFVVVILAGLALGLTRQTRKETKLFNALENSDASVVGEKSGLNDAYGLVVFKNGQFTVAEYLSECELNPPAALTIFRRAMDGSSKSAKLIAMHSANFLATTKQLEKDDFDKIVAVMRTPSADKSASPEANDLRRAAQRVVSDLTVINSTDASKLAAIPDNVKTPGEGEPSLRIVTQKQKVGGKEISAIRWSNVDLATEWWQIHSAKGAWDKGLQRFVIDIAK